MSSHRSVNRCFSGAPNSLLHYFLSFLLLYFSNFASWLFSFCIPIYPHSSSPHCSAGDLSVRVHKDRRWRCHNGPRTVRFSSLFLILFLLLLQLYCILAKSPVRMSNFLILGSSFLIFKILEAAHHMGKNFRVVVVDSRPKMQGIYTLLCWYDLSCLR